MLSWIEIDTTAIRHNYEAFCQIAGQERVAPVLKSNAYGHGLEITYRALQSDSQKRPSWICVNYVDEGQSIRDFGFDGRILVVGPAVGETLSQAAAAELELTIGCWPVLRDWLGLAVNSKTSVTPVLIKFDTGMGRQGFPVDEVDRVIEALLPVKDLVAGISTHFANVEDVTDYAYSQAQLEKFATVCQGFRQNGLSCIAHAASSASCLLLEESRLDLERLGISLYGLWPSQATKISYLQTYSELLELKPALSWRTRVTSVKTVAAGEFIGYGCTYRTPQKTRIAVLPVGYFEGYPRVAGGNASYVLIKGSRCPIVGRICMNMMMVDVNHLGEDVAVGDVATLIGKDRDETVAAADVAGWAQTIHYELVTCLHPSIPRVAVTR